MSLVPGAVSSGASAALSLIWQTDGPILCIKPVEDLTTGHLDMHKINRRKFLAATAASSAAVAMTAASRMAGAQEDKKSDMWFKISLAEWSLNNSIWDKKLTNLDFPRVAKEEFGIDAIEYVNQFFKTEVDDPKYMDELKKRCEDVGVKSLLIMVDGEGNLGDADENKRKKAVENHRRWLKAAKFLGCHSIRVNAASSGSYEEQVKLAADGLSRLAEMGKEYGLNVIVENHGGLSSNGAWLAEVIKKVGKENCGTLPDFGNFKVSKDEMYDRYKGVTELMPFAKAVSAKSHHFDDKGNETATDYLKMMKIVKAAGYRGYVGIEYEGGKIGEFEGVKATKKLLERCRQELGVASRLSTVAFRSAERTLHTSPARPCGGANGDCSGAIGDDRSCPYHSDRQADQLAWLVNLSVWPSIFMFFSFNSTFLAKVSAVGHLDNATRVRAQSLCTKTLHGFLAWLHNLFAKSRDRRKCLQNSEMLEVI